MANSEVSLNHQMIMQFSKCGVNNVYLFINVEVVDMNIDM